MRARPCLMSGSWSTSAKKAAACQVLVARPPQPDPNAIKRHLEIVDIVIDLIFTWYKASKKPGRYGRLREDQHDHHAAGSRSRNGLCDEAGAHPHRAHLGHARHADGRTAPPLLASGRAHQRRNRHSEEGPRARRG